MTSCYSECGQCLSLCSSKIILQQTMFYCHRNVRESCVYTCRHKY
jgi:hypothetical protein